MLHVVALWVALTVFTVGLAYKVSGWFSHGLAPGAATPAWSRVGAALRGVASTVFSARVLTLIEAFVLDAVLQRRILRQSASRWIAHLCLSGAFLLLLLMHGLGETITARLFSGYAPTLNPFLFLRDLLAMFLLVGTISIVYRRLFVRRPRRTTSEQDVYAIGIVGVILVSGILLEATKFGSYSAFRSMVQRYGEGPGSEAPLEAYWVQEMGTVSPGARADPALVERGREIHDRSCGACHSPTRSAFVGHATAAVLRPVAARLDRAGAPSVLRNVHFLACLAGLAYLPFSKLFHVITAPLSLLVNAVMARGKPDPANVATKQMIELDACTHCCTCSEHCSVAMATDAVGNAVVLPSERMRALRALAAGETIDAARLELLKQGVYLCTSCDRCTVSCPSGIDVLGLWIAAKEALLPRGEPAYALLSPLSVRRGLMQQQLDPVAYRSGVERPRRAIAAQFEIARLDPAATLTPSGGRLWAELRDSVQGSTFVRCFGCKGCTTACPVVRTASQPQQELGLLPHQLMHAARLSLWDLVLGSNLLWDCLGCYQCQESCPQGVAVTDVIYQLKNVAIARAMAEARAPRQGAA